MADEIVSELGIETKGFSGPLKDLNKVVADATATFNKRGMYGQNYPAELIHETALASLDKEFATIVTTHLIQNYVTEQQEIRDEPLPKLNYI